MMQSGMRTNRGKSDVDLVMVCGGDSTQTVDLAAGGRNILRLVDMGLFHQQAFQLRVSTSASAQMMNDTQRDLKHRWAKLSYVLQGFREVEIFPQITQIVCLPPG